MTIIVRWDGTQKNLPLANQPFFYKGKTDNFVWRPCNCKESCQRPIAYSVDFAMTTRLRGTNQGELMSNVLVKLGHMEELIQAGENIVAIAKLLNDVLPELPKPGEDGFESFLAKKDIPVEELATAVLKALRMSPFFRASILGL